MALFCKSKASHSCTGWSLHEVAKLGREEQGGLTRRVAGEERVCRGHHAEAGSQEDMRGYQQ